MENIAILGLRDKLTEIDKGINECANKNGSSMKSLLHIKDELNKAITILKACEGKMTKEGYGQLTIPDVVKVKRSETPVCHICDEPYQHVHTEDKYERLCDC